MRWGADVCAGGCARASKAGLLEGVRLILSHRRALASPLFDSAQGRLSRKGGENWGTRQEVRRNRSELLHTKPLEREKVKVAKRKPEKLFPPQK